MSVVFPFNQTSTMASNLLRKSENHLSIKLNYKSIFISLISFLRVEFMVLLITLCWRWRWIRTLHISTSTSTKNLWSEKKGKNLCSLLQSWLRSIILSIKIYSFRWNLSTYSISESSDWTCIRHNSFPEFSFHALHSHVNHIEINFI